MTLRSPAPRVVKGGHFITRALPQTQILFLNLSRPGCPGTANTARAGRAAAPRVWCRRVEARRWMEGNPPVRGAGAAAKGLSLPASTSLLTGNVFPCFPAPFRPLHFHKPAAPPAAAAPGGLSEPVAPGAVRGPHSGGRLCPREPGASLKRVLTAEGAPGGRKQQGLCGTKGAAQTGGARPRSCRVPSGSFAGGPGPRRLHSPGPSLGGRLRIWRSQREAPVPLRDAQSPGPGPARVQRDGASDVSSGLTADRTAERPARLLAAPTARAPGTAAGPPDRSSTLPHSQTRR